MLKKLLVICIILAVGLMFTMAQAEGEKKHEFVGVKKCKMCHKKDGVFPSWEKSAHATAFSKLEEADQKNEACLPCHSTGTTAKGLLLEGVQCESCHGAGADYKKKATMKDHDAAVAAGLLVPDVKTCETCHVAAVPEGHKERAKFDFAEFSKTGIHDLKPAEATK